MTEVLIWITALSALGGLVLGILNFARSISRTIVEVRLEATDAFADIPKKLSLENIEHDLRVAAQYLSPGANAPYSQPLEIRLVVRVSRRGKTPVNVEYVELGNAERQTSISRQPGQIDSAVRTIDSQSHHEWVFNFEYVASHFVNFYPAFDFPDLTIRVVEDSAYPLKLAKARPLKGKELERVVRAAQRVLPGFPTHA